MTYYTVGKYTLCCRVAGVELEVGYREILGIRRRTHIAQTRVDDAMHVGNSPLDYVAEALVVDIKVLPAHRTLCPFLEFVLTVANREGISRFWAQRPLLQFREKSESSRLYQSIFFQSGHELVKLFDLQPNPSCQVVILEAV